MFLAPISKLRPNKSGMLVFVMITLCVYLITIDHFTNNTLPTALLSKGRMRVAMLLGNTGVHENPNNFVLVPRSKFLKYTDDTKMADVHTSNSGSLNPLEVAQDDLKKYLKENKIVGARIVPKPNLAKLVNATQSIVTLTAPYKLENPTLCSSVPDLSVLIIVHTACQHFERRHLIRTTWANSSYYEHDIRILFLVGLTSKSDNGTKTAIEKEFNKFQDLLVGDFNDTYHNLTLKGVMAYKWITERCQNAKMILKVDDDIVVNMFIFFKEVYQKYMDKSRHIICNHIHYGSMPILRDVKSKWFVNDRHFTGYKTYPTAYCSGFMVIMTTDLVPLLYESSKITPFFWVDDVYLYGLVPGNVPGVQYTRPNGNWHMLGGQNALRCYRNATESCPYLAVGAGAKMEPEELWHEIMKREAVSNE